MKSFVEKDHQDFDSLCKQRTGQPLADLANKFPQKLGLRDIDAEVKAAKKQLCRDAPNSVVHPCKRVHCWQLTPMISASVKWTRLEIPMLIKTVIKSFKQIFVPRTENGIRDKYFTTFSSNNWNKLMPAEKAGRC